MGHIGGNKDRSVFFFSFVVLSLNREVSQKGEGDFNSALAGS